MQFFQRTSKMAYFCENLGIINKVWYLLCSLFNDIIQGELFTIKLLSFSFCHPLYWQFQLLLNLQSSKIISFSLFMFSTAQFQLFLPKVKHPKTKGFWFQQNELKLDFLNLLLGCYSWCKLYKSMTIILFLLVYLSWWLVAF